MQKVWWIGVGLVLTARAEASDCYFVARVGSKFSHSSGECEVEGSRALSGVERCNKDGKVVAELRWKGGKREGRGFFFDYNDQKLIFEFKDDKANGQAQVMGRDGKLLCEITFVDDKAEGVVKQYYPSGKLKGAYQYKAGESTGKLIELGEDGKVSHIECASESLVPEDNEPCGHSGKGGAVQITRGDGTVGGTEKWDKGRLTERRFKNDRGQDEVHRFRDPTKPEDYDAEILFKNGKPFQQFHIGDHRFDGLFNEFYESGSLAEESVFAAGQRKSQKLYYMNGKLKKSLLRRGDKNVDVEQFWDNGKLRSKGAFVEKRQYYYGFGDSSAWDYLAPEGKHLDYYESGALEAEENYSDGRLHDVVRRYFKSGKLFEDAQYAKGRVTRLKRYKENGAVEVDEEYFEDGSRKQR